MKIALVHDYLTIYGGGERVLESLHNIFPSAPIYTLVYSPATMPGYMQDWDVRTSFINKLPYKEKFLKYYVPLMPMAIESFDLREYDLVISVTAGFCKGVLTPIETCHISYTLTVPRFLWGYPTSSQSGHSKNILLLLINNYLRVWDKVSADRIDYFLSNSDAVKSRIKKSYNRDCDVVYSPVDISKYSLSQIQREKYYLIVSRLDKYKNIELAIDTFLKNGRFLQIVGDGPNRQFLEMRAKGAPNIQFLGRVSEEEVVRHYKSAKALIFPGADDLGLVPIEAQSCGTPVIAFRKDGALETIKDAVSGLFFDENSVESLDNAIKKLDQLTLDPRLIRQNGLKFSEQVFKYNITKKVSELYTEYSKKL